MNQKHKDVYALREQGRTFAEIAKEFGFSRARAQEIYIFEVDHLNMMAKHPCAFALRNRPDGHWVAGWLVKFLEDRKLTARDVAAKGAQWLREQPSVGIGKVTKFAWALENQSIITSADVWLGGGECLK